MWAGRLHRAARSSPRGQRPANPPILALPLPCAAAAAVSRADQGVGTEGEPQTGGLGKYFHVLPRARWLPPPRDKPATKRPAAAGPAAGAKPKKQKQKAEYERTMPQDMAFNNIHVRGNPGNDELDELELRNTVTDASWLKEALEVQQQPLRTMIRKGLPEWLVVTSDGLLCRSCILATKHGLRAGNYNVDENTAWVGRYCRRADATPSRPALPWRYPKAMRYRRARDRVWR